MDITADDYYSFDFSLKVRLSSVTFVQHNENTEWARCQLRRVRKMSFLITTWAVVNFKESKCFSPDDSMAIKSFSYLKIRFILTVVFIMRSVLDILITCFWISLTSWGKKKGFYCEVGLTFMLYLMFAVNTKTYFNILHLIFVYSIMTQDYPELEIHPVKLFFSLFL